MPKFIFILISALISETLLCQSNYEQFKILFKENDTTGIKILLKNWEKEHPEDPELYTAAFNFYYSGSKQEIISIDRETQGNESLQMTDSTGAVAGYLNSHMGYNPQKLEKAFHYINKGIEKFPQRLDMRFGKCYVLGIISEYGLFTTEIIRTIEYSNTIQNNWQWTENKKLDDAENFMLGSVQSYLKQLYETEDDRLLENMILIGNTTLKYYPNHIEILSTTAVANMLMNQYDQAIVLLRHAEELNPKDFIVLSNLAHAYKLKGDKENAIKYYELVKKYGDEQAKESAESEIKKLKK